jgi:hypothetical protein
MVAHLLRPQHGHPLRGVAHRVAPCRERYRSGDSVEVSARGRHCDRHDTDSCHARAARRATASRATDRGYPAAGAPGHGQHRQPRRSPTGCRDAVEGNPLDESAGRVLARYGGRRAALADFRPRANASGARAAHAARWNADRPSAPRAPRTGRDRPICGAHVLVGDREPGCAAWRRSVPASPSAARARTWQKTATDSTAGFQAAGGVGLYLYLSGTATNAPITASFDDFRAVPGP